MKLFLILIALLQLLTTAWCQLPVADPSAPHIQTESDLSKLLLATTWSWERDGVTNEEINFFDEGIAQHTAFRAKFKVKNAREVELNWHNRTAELVFDTAYTSYTGKDFNGTTSIHGRRKNNPPQNFLMPSLSTTPTQVTGALLGNTWDFDAPKLHYKERRKFSPDGSWQALNSTVKGTWKVQQTKLLVTVSIKPNSPETYPLPPRIFEPAAGKVHLEGSGSNGDAVKLDIADLSVPADTPAPDKASYFGTKQP